MKIVVLIKQVADTAEERLLDVNTGRLDREASEAVFDEINERALEVALQYKDSNKGTSVVLMSMGPKDALEALRRGLSMGADSAVHVLDQRLEGADAAKTASVLAAALRTVDFDLVLAGNESTDGRSGVVPAMVAEHLGLPLLGGLMSAEITEGDVRGQRQGEDGVLQLRSSLPAVITVTERSAEARFPSFKGILGAKRKQVNVLSLEDLPPLNEQGASRTVVLSTQTRPARSAGRKIIDDGTAAEELAEFLVTNRLA
ncbi:electron transfer flavoprotein subunit beta/FixA family protein [Pseudarthrobacter sp. R1]|uniref:electron transfer flavoprotein subunit beta/FixA family protein n=1 Tax=Pseudarthrobacter sp. R1 TaxID=2944934 RepID=UPI00210EBBCC|nr:electron transfer flavoprotein subunit beta/FixA family protein [Pseudarthrobacter sp. R1]MCQ6272760.1 electron transfer flavoprotein subunit beta/FixA family protein [Pseudarthrobacter sp. R1]